MDNPYQTPEALASRAVVPDQRDVVFYKRNELREMAWKLAAIALVVKVASMIATIGMYGHQLGLSAWWYALPILVSSALAVFCYLQSRSYEHAPEHDDTNAVDPGVVVMMQRVAFSILGVFIVVDWFPTALGSLIALADGLRGMHLPNAYATDIGNLVVFAFGVFLFFGANGVSRLWWSLRKA